MSQIPREIIDEIIHRSDIEQVIGSYVTLKRAGSNFNGLCPFHNEKTPSFTVFPATKSFYCFGCGAGGENPCPQLAGPGPGPGVQPDGSRTG